MAYKFRSAREIYSKGFDVFSPPSVEVATEAFYYEPFEHPQITKGQTLTFVVPSTSPDYIYLPWSYFKFKVKITKGASTALTAADKVGVINNLFHSLWKSVDLWIGRERITKNCDGNYHIKAYFDTLFYTDAESKKTVLQGQGWYPDTAGSFTDITTGESANNEGYDKRSSFFSLSKEVELAGMLFMDGANDGSEASSLRFLLNGVGLTIKLAPNDDKLLLMSNADNNDYRLHITEATFYPCYVKCDSGILVSHNEALSNKQNAIYPFNRSFHRQYQIKTGTTKFSDPDVFSGMTPSVMYLAIATQTAADGSLTTNPFEFKHHNLCQIDVCVGGNRTAIQPLTCKYSSGEYMDAFMSLFPSRRDVVGLPFDRKGYPNGYCIYRFQLTPPSQLINEEDENGRDVMSLLKKNNVTLNIQFSPGPTETVNLHVYAKFPDVYEVDLTRRVLN